MKDTSAGGNQPPSGLREDPVGDGGKGVPHATDSSSLSDSSWLRSARALVEQWRENYQHFRGLKDGPYPRPWNPIRADTFKECADELETVLSALLVQAGALEEHPTSYTLSTAGALRGEAQYLAQAGAEIAQLEQSNHKWMIDFGMKCKSLAAADAEVLRLRAELDTHVCWPPSPWRPEEEKRS